MTKKKVVEEEVTEKTGKVYISCNQGLEVVIPGVPGIIVLRPGENEIKDRKPFIAKELAEGIIRDHGNSKQGLSLTLIEK